MQLSRRVRELAPSATLMLDARAKELIAQGVDVVNMAVGEPDFPAPEAVRAAAHEKIDGEVRYTQAAGTPSLRKAIAHHVSETRGIEVGPDEVSVCHSAKHALAASLLSVCEEGDEVLVLLPAWGSYFAQIEIAGARVVLVPPRPGARPDLEALAAAITPRSRAVMINSPCNPTGYVWSLEEIRALTALAEAHDLWILSDEIYRRILYDDTRFCSPLQDASAGRGRTILIDGASKAFAMTGYRIGYVVAPRVAATAVTSLNSQMTGSPNAISQAAFERALWTEPPEVAAMVSRFAERRRVLLDGLNALGLSSPVPNGAFYVFPDVSEHLDARGVEGFCADVLEEQALALVPGTVFGTEGHVRFSYALSTDRLTEALRRFAAFLKK